MDVPGKCRVIEGRIPIHSRKYGGFRNVGRRRCGQDGKRKRPSDRLLGPVRAAVTFHSAQSLQERHGPVRLVQLDKAFMNGKTGEDQRGQRATAAVAATQQPRILLVHRGRNHRRLRIQSCPAVIPHLDYETKTARRRC